MSSLRLSLAQFEVLDGALSSYLRDASPRNESRLFDAVIDLIGYDAACDVPSLSQWAAGVVTRYLVAA